MSLGIIDIGTVSRAWKVSERELVRILVEYGYQPRAFDGALSDDAILTLVNHYELEREFEKAMASMRSSVAAKSPAAPVCVFASLKSGGTAAVAQKGNKVATFKGIAYSGVPVSAGTSTPKLDSDYVLDLAGMKPARSPKVNLDHDRAKRVGHVTKFYNSGSQIELAGLISAATEFSAQVATSAAAGFSWELSIEAVMSGAERLAKGAVATVNGRQVAGPMVIFRKSELTGVAFVDAGADRETSVEVSHDIDSDS